MELRDNNGRIDIRTLARIAGGEIAVRGEGRGGVPDRGLQGRIVIDSREVISGDVFAALKGGREDGERYIGAALRDGACAVLCRKGASERVGASGVYIEVGDVEKALGAAARALREKSGVTVVGVTGSVGKTTVKDMCISVLGERYPTDGTEGNRNNALGVPLSILNCDFGTDKAAPRGKTEKYLVLEMGISLRGEMALLADIARPDIAVITNIGEMHLATLGTRERVASEKTRIVTESCRAAVFDGDEPLLSPLRSRGGLRLCSVSARGDGGSYSAVENVRVTDGETVFDLRLGGERPIYLRRLSVPVVGRHGAADGALAATVGHICGCGEEEIRRGLSSYLPSGMRQRTVERDGITRLIDCYNAGPASMRAALEWLSAVGAARRGARRIAVLGSMLELGERSFEEHFRLGEEVAGSGVDILFCVGREAEGIALGAVKGGFSRENIRFTENYGEPFALREEIELLLREGDIILYKGSRGIGLERALPKELAQP